MKFSKKAAAFSASALVGAGVLLPAGSAGAAQLLPTAACDLKGTSGNNTLNVSVPAGTTAQDPYVVCTGLGNDTININSVATNDYLYIALGNGNKTINWNAGSIDWNPFNGTGNGIITTPVGNYSITVGAHNNTNVEGSYFVCALNSEYQTKTSALTLFPLTNRFLNFYGTGGSGAYYEGLGCPTGTDQPV